MLPLVLFIQKRKREENPGNPGPNSQGGPPAKPPEAAADPARRGDGVPTVRVPTSELLTPDIEAGDSAEEISSPEVWELLFH
ncbi:hypothetical protein KM732_gp1 [Sciurus carolinensis polyomavirus 1]|uniref:Uncharacterized protein n=1 Tax=Sciurus carolinensis polyomavirus 1 TaxID=2721750 RepID=A0A6G9LWB7_9POLY|nr:hypothetical protein KM732_gp1 [Sciurus carolinensis polyomavirus 1]QIQ69375.1 hypothetical protein [Sciurus carolinensis polyomavirus 1]